MLRVLGVVAVVLVGLAILSAPFGGFGHAGYGMGSRYMGYGDGPWGWGPGFLLLGGLFKVLFIVGLVLVIGALLRQGGARWYGTPGHGTPAPAESPLDILKRRLAKGEISREEYETLKTEIS
jgi:putative membrane protein